ncbi:hypothetical protein IQ13_3075 [Lacibacter cauensis]|uniref:Uncharacterized protein n=1 Tax=Lacibacter cauensis TaxID=510947 RepID=A0A562SGT9_9BACT|nr:hypothetical protein [Lacibacter cauensis]TWI80398.1 hypothetical protein IQ13_3075 [Lacibacter cauensis]
MGYDFHIVRRNDWADYEEDSNISLEEWLAFVQSDNELEFTNGYQIKIPGVENSFQNVPGFCNWTGHSTRVSDDKPWFDYGYGMISTKNPDEETIRKMITIAEKFNGRVQGDDGEFYDESYFQSKTDPFTQNTTKLITNKPWWKFW